MEVINTEILISSLFSVGFDKVDSLLFTFTLAKISLDNHKKELFQFKDRELGTLFNTYVQCNHAVFRLKPGYTLATKIRVNDYLASLGMLLNSNRLLVDYLNRLDFSEIIIKKASFLGIKSIEDINYNLFSYKEIEILNQLLLDGKKMQLKK